MKGSLELAFLNNSFVNSVLLYINSLTRGFKIRCSVLNCESQISIFNISFRLAIKNALLILQSRSISALKGIDLHPIADYDFFFKYIFLETPATYAYLRPLYTESAFTHTKRNDQWLCAKED